MPRRRRDRTRDLDFEIHVDSSCDTLLKPEDLITMDRQAAAALDTHAHDECHGQDDCGGFQPDGKGGEPANDSHEPSSPRPASPMSAQEQADNAAEMEDATPRRQSVGSTASRITAGSSRRASRCTEELIYAVARDDPADTIDPKDGDSDDAEAEAGDSSSHHENEDDVFSDNSPRSSMGSMSETEQAKIEQALSQRNITQRTRSPRISDIPPSDQDEDFMPTIRGIPRPPFRSPSSVQAMQMNSPPPSPYGTPRSARRTPLPTVSRLGSPSITAQYSPKKTPPRFKRATPPLVLLHVTLLPLRWSLGQVLDRATPADLSPEAKTLREAWRQLQDRTGDTVSDRGILLPHPQNDYEVLEERLLEALELPLRRRARILECGHYLGPANEITMREDMDSDADDDEYAESYADSFNAAARAALDKTHWCRTCHSDIRYDSLGEGKVFRVKVYASNGLMRAGAWAACWKEMERVDVELEPIVDGALQEELSALAVEHQKVLEMQQALAEDQATAAETDDEEEVDEEEAYDEHYEHHPDEEDSYLEQEQDLVREHELRSSLSPHEDVRQGATPVPDDEGHHARYEEERIRDFHERNTPQPHHDGSSASNRQHGGYTPQESTTSPPRTDRAQAYKQASLPELILEALRVLMQDKKNAMIGLLSVLILMLAIRGGRPAHDSVSFQPMMEKPNVRVMPMKEPVVQAVFEQQSQEQMSAGTQVSQSTASSAFASSATAASVSDVSLDPCGSLGELQPIPVMSTSTLRIIETWRVVETVTETARETLTETQTVSVEVPLETDALAIRGI